jgi:hypothetical protein
VPSTPERRAQHVAAKHRARRRSGHSRHFAAKAIARCGVSAPCGVSEEHPAASVKSTLRRQRRAPCRVRSEHAAASVKSTLRRQRRAPCRVSSEHPAASAPSTLRRQRRAPCGVSDSSHRVRMVVSFLSDPGDTVPYRSALRTISSIEKPSSFTWTRIVCGPDCAK